MADAKLVMQLREQTGAGILDAKKALEESGDDLTKAAELLRKKGAVKAASKSDRETHEGVVHAYIHAGGKVGALVEVLCETDFVARNEQFQAFVHDIAMHVAAANPLYVRPEDVPEEVIEKEKEIAKEHMAGENKPAEIIEKILGGKINKYFEETCLLKQAFVKDDSVTIEELLKGQIAKIGENIQIKRFVRFSLM